jgi:YidC/Oxa1 family membrane protein insertase
MEKRAILAIVLSLVVVVTWSIFFAPSPSSPPVRAPESPPALPSAPPATAPPSLAPGNVPTTSSSGAVEQTASSLPVASTEVIVDTGVARIVLTSQGAGVKHVRLRDFRVGLEAASPHIEMGPVAGVQSVPLATELVLDPRQAPLSLGQVVFAPDSAAARTLSADAPESTVTFRSEVKPGLIVHRRYHFFYGSYAFEVETWLEGIRPQDGSALLLLWGPGLLEHTDEVKRQGQTAVQPRSYVNGKVLQEAPEKDGQPVVHHGKVTWTALGDTYFAAALVPLHPEANAVVVRRTEGEALTVGVQTPLQAPNQVQSVRVYTGPKHQPTLVQIEPSLDKLIDLGVFSPLARPMLGALRWVHGFVGNYGVSIILVTVLIKILLWPLTQKSYKSMQAMQKLQPKLKELQVLYKDDRQGINRAMMQLYRDQKINPMGGCLPMLLQVPFFFAFYNALLYAIELRHAPFICWDQPIFGGIRGICDLSVYDPSYVTPILMGVSMFFQQKMTPTTVADPMQAKIMQFMPLIFLIFFLNAPAGLVLYWLVNNVLSIVQQVWVNRMRSLEDAKVEAISKG